MLRLVIINSFQIEWEAMKSKLRIKGRQIVISEDDFCLQVDPKVLMGHSSNNYKIVLSQALFKEYKEQVPSSKNRFTCADCGASFNHFHILSNHIHMAHILEVIKQLISLKNGTIFSKYHSQKLSFSFNSICFILD